METPFFCPALAGVVGCAEVPRQGHPTNSPPIVEGAKTAQNLPRLSAVKILVCGFVSPRPNSCDGALALDRNRNFMEVVSSYWVAV